MADLESFVKTYLKNKKISDYEGWLAAYGKDAESAYGEATRAADSRYAASRAEYGARAVSLASRGLSGSGYSDYLNTVAYAEHARAKENALLQKQKTESENQRGYLAYLEAQAALDDTEQSAEEKRRTEAFDDLLKKGISDKGAAVTYLTERGFDEQTASDIANSAIKVYRGSDSYRKYVTEQAISNQFFYADAYRYALLQGLSPAMADEVAKIASYTLAAGESANVDPNVYYQGID